MTTFTSTSKNPSISLPDDGPWVGEPDRADFMHAGFPCFVKRSAPAGAWCGYVGVSPTHPLFGKDYSVPQVSVHGGLTYADKCNERSGICHVAAESDPEPWWFGFDCAHPGDMVPDARRFRSTVRDRSFFGMMSDDLPDDDGTYRDLKFVVDQTVALAEQLQTLEKGNT